MFFSNDDEDQISSLLRNNTAVTGGVIENEVSFSTPNNKKKYIELNSKYFDKIKTNLSLKMKPIIEQSNVTLYDNGIRHIHYYNGSEEVWQRKELKGLFHSYRYGLIFKQSAEINVTEPGSLKEKMQRHRIRYRFTFPSYFLDITQVEQTVDNILHVKYEIELEMSTFTDMDGLNQRIAEVWKLVYDTNYVYSYEDKYSLIDSVNELFNSKYNNKSFVRNIFYLVGGSKEKVAKIINDIFSGLDQDTGISLLTDDPKIKEIIKQAIMFYNNPYNANTKYLIDNIVKSIKKYTTNEVEVREGVNNVINNMGNIEDDKSIYVNDIMKSINRYITNKDKVKDIVTSKLTVKVHNIDISNLVQARNVTFNDLRYGKIVGGSIPYKITPKSDGIRKLMIYNGSKVWLVYPPYEYNLLLNEDDFSLDEMDIAYKTINNTEPGVFVFDGEYYDDNKIYSPFDCIVCMNRNIEYLNHTARYAIAERFKAAFTSERIQIVTKSFNLLTINFFAEMRDAFAVPKLLKTDGFIFIPDTIYNTKEPALLKYKSVRESTMDLLVKEVATEEIYQFYYLDNSKEELFVGSEKHPFNYKDIDLNSFKDDNGKFLSLNKRVIELYYDNGKLYFKGIRYNKNQPNDKRVILSIWKNIHNPIRDGDLKGETFTFVRKYHNRIKTELYDMIPTGSTNLDVGSGKGGDITKEKRLKTIYAVEPDEDNIKSFIERLNTYYSNVTKEIFKVLVPASEINKAKKIFRTINFGDTRLTIFRNKDDKYLTKYDNKFYYIDKDISIPEFILSKGSILDFDMDIKVDTATLMFSLSFFWKDSKTLDKLVDVLVKRVTHAIYFITIDGNRLNEVMGDKDVLDLQSAVFKRKGGNVITFSLDDSIIKEEQEEYLVYIDDLTLRLKKHGFNLKMYEIANKEELLTENEKIYTSLYTYGYYVKDKEFNVKSKSMSSSEEDIPGTEEEVGKEPMEVSEEEPEGETESEDAASTEEEAPKPRTSIKEEPAGVTEEGDAASTEGEEETSEKAPEEEAPEQPEEGAESEGAESEDTASTEEEAPAPKTTTNVKEQTEEEPESTASEGTEEEPNKKPISETKEAIRLIPEDTANHDNYEKLTITWVKTPLYRIGCRGDGSCLIHAVLKGIDRKYQDSANGRRTEAKSIRLSMITYLTQEYNTFTYWELINNGIFIERYINELLQKKYKPKHSLTYIRELLHSNEYLGDESITILSSMFKINIITLVGYKDETELAQVFDFIPFLPDDKLSNKYIVIIGNINHWEIIAYKNNKGKLTTIFTRKDELIKNVLSYIDVSSDYRDNKADIAKELNKKVKGKYLYDKKVIQELFERVRNNDADDPIMSVVSNEPFDLDTTRGIKSYKDGSPLYNVV